MALADIRCDTPTVTRTFASWAAFVARVSGRPVAFGVALVTVLIWAMLGPVFAYSDTWQLVINTGTTIVTFLMVFLIQNTQNRDSAALQAKLDELIRVTAAQNRFIGIENLTEDEINELRKRRAARADVTGQSTKCR